MKTFIVTLCLIGTALAGPPPPECLAGPPKDKTALDCCQLPELIPADMFSKCEAANPRPPPPNPPSPPKGCCMSECVMNETAIMQNGKLDKVAAVKYLSGRMAGDAEAIKAVTAAVDFCEKEGNTKKPDFDEMAKLPATAGEKVCNMISGYMIGCVQGQFFKNCPKDKYKAEPACEGIKAFVEKCGFLYPQAKA